MQLNLSTDAPDPTDPLTINWSQRQARALIPFTIGADGLPVNPVEADLPAGRHLLWHWGEAVTVDAAVLLVDPDTGDRRILMIERVDGLGWALPGGKLDDTDVTPQAGVVRELHEETGLKVAASTVDLWGPRYVPDPRAGRAAWMVTIPGRIVIHARTAPSVAGADDAERAEWLPADSVEQLETAIGPFVGSGVFAAHVDLLCDVLA